MKGSLQMESALSIFIIKIQNGPLQNLVYHVRTVQCYVQRNGATVQYLWMPEHWMHSVMPRLMLAQRGSGWPQSQQQELPGMVSTFCRALSPFRGFSLGSPPESRLPVDVDALLSSFWRGGEHLCQSDLPESWTHVARMFPIVLSHCLWVCVCE